MSLRRTLAIGRAHVHELLRRKLAIGLLLALPLAFYFVAFDDGLAISFATVGFGWSIAIISLFSTQSLSSVTPRLTLLGFQSGELVAGRVLGIACYGVTFGGLLFMFLQTDDVVDSPLHLAASLAFALLGSCTAGLAIGAITDRETEAMLVLIGLVALTLVVRSDSLLAQMLPMFAADEHAWAAVDGRLEAGRSPWRSTVPVSASLGLVAVVATFIRLPRPNRA